MTDDDDLLAAEQVLGLADEGAREARDPAFAAAVEAWRERLLPLLGPDRAPPPALWEHILARLPANDDAADPARPWRIATFAASAAAAVLLGVILLRPVPEASAPAPGPQVAQAPAPARLMVASLTPKAGAGAVTVTYDDRDGRLLVNPVGMDAGGKAAELWVIPADGTPRSLGVVPDKAATARIVPRELRALVAGATFAVSLEPEGGSPTGLPTGPVVMTGTMSIV